MLHVNDALASGAQSSADSGSDRLNQAPAWPAGALPGPQASSMWMAILPNWAPDSRRLKATQGRKPVRWVRLRKSRNSSKLPSVEPKIWSWRMKIRRRSAGGWSPLHRRFQSPRPRRVPAAGHHLFNDVLRAAVDQVVGSKQAGTLQPALASSRQVSKFSAPVRYSSVCSGWRGL